MQYVTVLFLVSMPSNVATIFLLPVDVFINFWGGCLSYDGSPLVGQLGRKCPALPHRLQTYPTPWLPGKENPCACCGQRRGTPARPPVLWLGPAAEPAASFTHVLLPPTWPVDLQVRLERRCWLEDADYCSWEGVIRDHLVYATVSKIRRHNTLSLSRIPMLLLWKHYDQDDTNLWLIWFRASFSSSVNISDDARTDTSATATVAIMGSASAFTGINISVLAGKLYETEYLAGKWAIFLQKKIRFRILTLIL